MKNNKHKIIYFLGPSKSGKTTSIESIITALSREGITCGSIKFIHHPHVTLDPPGKDSSRHRNAGALFSINFAPKETAIIITKEQRESIFDAKKILENNNQLLPPVDILICESLNTPPAGSFVFISANNKDDVETYAENLQDSKILGILGNISNMKLNNDVIGLFEQDIPIFSGLDESDIQIIVSIIKNAFFKV
jgi:molybdopterin-guanine dinucleotide biosynthesis protein B